MLRKFFPISGVNSTGAGFSVLTTPAIFFHYTANASAVVERTIVAKARNGSGSYTYAWVLNADAGIEFTTGTTTDTVTIRVTGSGSADIFHGVASVTATDTATGQTAEFDLTIEVQCGGSIV